MSLKRRAIGGIVISGLLVTMSTVAASANQVAAEQPLYPLKQRQGRT